MTKVVLLEGKVGRQTVSVPAWWLDRLRTEFPTLEFVSTNGVEEGRDALFDAEVAYGAVNKEMLANAPRLRLLQAPMANPKEGFLYPELAEHPVIVTRMSGVYDDYIGTHTLSFIFAFARGLDLYGPLRDAHDWRKVTSDESVVPLDDAVLLLVGVGGIARFVARIAASLGMSVIGVDVKRLELSQGITAIYGVDKLDELLGEADFVLDTVPDSPNSRGLFDRARFQKMQPSAFFLNVARGSTVRLAELADALVAGELAGAALDVQEQEPLPPEHPIWNSRRLILTPHVAMRGPHLDERRYETFADSLRRFHEGKPPVRVMDKVLGF